MEDFIEKIVKSTIEKKTKDALNATIEYEVQEEIRDTAGKIIRKVLKEKDFKALLEQAIRAAMKKSAENKVFISKMAEKIEEGMVDGFLF